MLILHVLTIILSVINISIVIKMVLSTIWWATFKHKIWHFFVDLKPKWQARKCKGEHDFQIVAEVRHVQHVSCLRCDVEYIRDTKLGINKLYNACSARMFTSIKSAMLASDLLREIVEKLEGGDVI